MAVAAPVLSPPVSRTWVLVRGQGFGCRGPGRFSGCRVYLDPKEPTVLGFLTMISLYYKSLKGRLFGVKVGFRG